MVMNQKLILGYIGRNQWLMPFIGFDARYRKLERNEVEKSFGQKTLKTSVYK
jgi:hypothetical protein